MSAAACPVVILNFNTASLTLRLVDSLRATEVSGQSIWVVDNGSTPSEAAALAAGATRFRLLRLAENRGFAGGVNMALRQAGDEGHAFAYVLNSDTLVTPGFLTSCLAQMQRLPRLALLFSRCFQKGGSGRYDVPGFMCAEGDRAAYSEGVFFTDKMLGCGMLVRLAPFREAGGMDERFFCYFEETDLCIRLQARAYATGICFASVIYHDHHGSDRNDNAVYYTTRNTHLLCAKHWAHGRVPLPLQLGHYLPLILLAQVTAATGDLLLLRCGRARARVEGCADGRHGRWGPRPRTRSRSSLIGMFLGNVGALVMALVRRRRAK
jgi:GT2 family glycosyltransferase